MSLVVRVREALSQYGQADRKAGCNRVDLEAQKWGEEE